MINEIYGSFKTKNRLDYCKNLIKAFYLLYTLPFLVIGVLYYFVTLSNFDESMSLKGISTMGKVLIHILANMVSIIFYVCIYRVVTGN